MEDHNCTDNVLPHYQGRNQGAAMVLDREPGATTQRES